MNQNGQLHTLSAEYFPENRKWTYRDVLLWVGKALEECRAQDKMLVELDGVRQALNELLQTDNQSQKILSCEGIKV